MHIDRSSTRNALRAAALISSIAVAAVMFPAPAPARPDQSQDAAMAAAGHANAETPRIFVDLLGFVGFMDCPGDLTIFQRGDRPGWASERPWDVLHVEGIHRSFMEPDISAICDREGSELRFMGKRSTGAMTITTEPGVRLCFRKTEGGWIYLCGLGTVEYEWDKLLHGLAKIDAGTAPGHQSKALRLGYDRTVDSCLKALASDDPLAREGNVRDLGRLAAGQRAAEATAKVTPLLRDAVPAVRRGATEALGLLGTAAGLAALREAAGSETDKRTRAYIEEALAIYGATALFDPASVGGIAPEEAAALYLAGNSGWADRVLIYRMRALSDVVGGVSNYLQSANPVLRAAAVELLGLAGTSEGRKTSSAVKDIRKALEPLKKDADPKVQAALRKAALRIGNRDFLLD